MQTVVELPEFQRRAKAVMSDSEREAAILRIAGNPDAGVSLGGGLRKDRRPREGGDESKGFRTIYVFAKNEKANLSANEQAAAMDLSKEIVSMWNDKQ